MGTDILARPVAVGLTQTWEFNIFTNSEGIENRIE